MQALLLSLVFSVGAGLVSAQLTIPTRELGFVYGDGLADADIKIVAYIDLTCPDSQAAYPTLLALTHAYLPAQVQLRFHLFSLPYHRNSHVISKAVHVLAAYKSAKQATIFDWIKAVYDNIDNLSTAATTDKTDVQVLDFLASLAFNVTGISNAEFKAGVGNTDVDLATRLDWKYSCTRGVYGTPLFTVNDVFVNAEATWTVNQWIILIDSLLFIKRK